MADITKAKRKKIEEKLGYIIDAAAYHWINAEDETLSKKSRDSAQVSYYALLAQAKLLGWVLGRSELMVAQAIQGARSRKEHEND